MGQHQEAHDLIHRRINSLNIRWAMALGGMTVLLFVIKMVWH